MKNNHQFYALIDINHNSYSRYNTTISDQYHYGCIDSNSVDEMIEIGSLQPVFQM